MTLLKACRQRVVRFHTDTRGAISILVALTIWCLVAMIGLVWNSMEEARRRGQIQTAADASAHAAATWLARTGNAINAQNMVICQDASAESIWRAITPADQAINGRLNGEIALATQMKQQQTLADLQRRIQAQIIQIGVDYQLTTQALNNLNTGNGANFATPAERILFMNQLRQAASVRDWVFNTYVNGRPPAVADPAAPPRPGPPGPNGEGLVEITNNWKSTTSQNQILDYIINFIMTQEKPYQVAFEQRTAPALAQPVDVNMANHEAEVYANEVAMLQALPAVIEAQRKQIADFYRVDVTLATLKNSGQNSGPAVVTAPYIPASDVAPYTGHMDLIRRQYPAEAAAAGLPLIYDMDAINPNAKLFNDVGRDSRIWHPNLVVAVPESLRLLYPNLGTSYSVSAGTGWGDLVAMPLERYFQQRVGYDLQELDQAYMVPLDRARSVTLAQAIRQMLGVPQDIRITPLPASIPDDRAEPVIPVVLPPGTPQPPPPPPRYDRVFVLPRLTAPPNANAAYRTQVDLYNSNGAKLTGDTRALVGLIINYVNYFERFITPFASLAWQSNVHVAAAQVLETLGEKKQFMVLNTYGLRPIPDWAQSGMYDSAVATIENQVLTQAMNSLTRTITNDMMATNAGGVGGGILDQSTLQNVLTGAYAAQAAAVAGAIIRPAAHQIAVEIAAEWVNRPWPYEITPPDMPVPPQRGLRPDERKRQFTVVAAARQTDATAPRLLLPTLFGADSSKIVAYAQGEMFNWMEFDGNFGAQPYDQTINIPELVHLRGTVTFTDFVGAPRGWRVASTAGWQWRARLSLSDALYEALQNNPELQQYFNDAGMSSPSSGAFDALNLH